MTKPGRRPTPTPLHLLRGASHHKQPDREPAAAPGRVDPPEYLEPEERELWEELAPELVRNHLLAPRYRHQFEMAVFSIIEFRKSAALLRITGPVTRGRGDVLVSSPASRETARWIDRSLRLGQEFGMTPSAVTAIARAAGEGEPDRADPARLLS